MTLIQNHIHDLAHLGLSPEKEFNIDGAWACKTGAESIFYNRVYMDQPPSEKTIKALKTFYKNAPFSLWVLSSDEPMCDALLQQGFMHKISFPLMTLDSAAFSSQPSPETLVIEPIEQDENVLGTWCDVVAQIYQTNPAAFKQYIHYFLCSEQRTACHFYLGYEQQQPVAASMFVNLNNCIQIHWVGVEPQHRQKGIGYAISAAPLARIRTPQTVEASLYASTMGESVYQRIGFVTQATVDVYCPAELI